MLNGTSSSNKIAIGALVAHGDLVLFDRNNHKSVYQGALTMAGGTPVYLETDRNAYGLIGGIPALDNISTNQCMWGGVIMITSPGQFTEMIP